MTGTGPTLGKKQIGVLSALINHGRWHRGPTCGWSWSTTSETERTLRSVGLKKFVTETQDVKPFAGQVTVYLPDLEVIALDENLPEYIRKMASEKKVSHPADRDQES